MNISRQQEKGMELMNTLVQKAWEDAAFKDQLVSNPVGTIKEFSGGQFKLSDDYKFIVEDQSDEDIIFLNIPSRPNFDTSELTYEQLESISGGGPFYDLGYWASNKVIDGIQWLGDQFTRE